MAQLLLHVVETNLKFLLLLRHFKDESLQFFISMYCNYMYSAIYYKLCFPITSHKIFHFFTHIN